MSGPPHRRTCRSCSTGGSFEFLGSEMTADAYSNFDAAADLFDELDTALHRFGEGIIATGRQGGPGSTSISTRRGTWEPGSAAWPPTTRAWSGETAIRGIRRKRADGRTRIAQPRVVLSDAAMTVDCAVIQRETPTPERPHRRTEGPVRTCVGCRRRELAVDLLRVVAVSNGNGHCALTVDQAGNLPGRGAWLHPTTGAFRQRSDGELSVERCASPVHRIHPRWSSTSRNRRARPARQENRQRRT